jgi:hypothetical protein
MALAAPVRSRATSELVFLTAAFVASLALTGCRADASGSSLDLVLPEGVGRRVELAPRSAFAEYVELPELRRELRVTLASYPLSCDRYVAPGPAELLFVLTLTSPAKEPFAPGPISFGSAPPSDAGPPERVGAFAVARQGEHGFDFPSGGTVELRQVDVSVSGHVQGVLALEFPGDGSRPAAGAHGKFDARMCRGD